MFEGMSRKPSNDTVKSSENKRRHKFRCKYYNDNYCEYMDGICTGSNNCQHYIDMENSAVSIEYREFERRPAKSKFKYSLEKSLKIGDRISLMDLSDGMKLDLEIVRHKEEDLMADLISIESRIVRDAMGLDIGDIIRVGDRGHIKYKILDIKKGD